MHRRNHPRASAHVLAFGLCLIFATIARGQTDNFAGGQDTGWTHYDPLAGVGASPAIYSFPSGGYRIQDPPFDNVATYGPSRAGSLREDVTYSAFSVAVDLLDWDTSHDQAIGLLSRITTPGLGTMDGYVFSYSVGSQEIDLTRSDNEQPTNLGLTKVALTAGHGYRLVFTGIGDQLTGQVFDDANLLSPLATVTATDDTYTSGVNGLIVFDNTYSPDGSLSNGADATFGNYAAFNPIQVTSVPIPAGAGAATFAGAGLLLLAIRWRKRSAFPR